MPSRPPPPTAAARAAAWHTLWVDADGHRLEVARVDGNGPTLVFLHEGLGSVSAWRDFPQRLAAATGHAAVVYSRWGYGPSDPVTLPRPVTFMHDEARRTLPALLSELAIADAILIGHSDGASIALIHIPMARFTAGQMSGCSRNFVRGISRRCFQECMYRRW